MVNYWTTGPLFNNQAINQSTYTRPSSKWKPSHPERWIAFRAGPVAAYTSALDVSSFLSEILTTRDSLLGSICIAQARSWLKFFLFPASAADFRRRRSASTQQLNNDKYSRSPRRSGALIKQRIYCPISNSDVGRTGSAQ